MLLLSLPSAPILTVMSKVPHVFRTLSNIYGGASCDITQRILAVSHKNSPSRMFNKLLDTSGNEAKAAFATSNGFKIFISNAFFQLNLSVA